MEESTTFRLEFELKPAGVAPAPTSDVSQSEGGRAALLERLEKEDLTDEKNLLTSYTAARTTQTDGQHVQTETGPELCPGGWQAKGTFSAAGGELRKPRSKVVLKVPVKLFILLFTCLYMVGRHA